MEISYLKIITPYEIASSLSLLAMTGWCMRLLRLPTVRHVVRQSMDS
ncbi:hypothetical protein KAX35_07220 [candidate division WOR-3 bacterium]|nr:hypothetical protein [candidate division WOR-3 bacterium]